MNDALHGARARYESEAERLREHLADLGIALDVAAARTAVSRLHGASGWEALLAAQSAAALECYHVDVVGSDGIMGEHLYAFGLAGGMAVLLDRVRVLLRNHAFTAVKASRDSARLMILDLTGSDVHARVTLEYGPVHDAATLVDVSAEILAHARDLSSGFDYVAAAAARMRDEVRFMRQLPYPERLVEACRQALENEPWALRYAQAVLELERLAHGGKLSRHRAVPELQKMVPLLAALTAQQAEKVICAAAWALSFYGQGYEDIAYGQEGLRIRPADVLYASAPQSRAATIH